MDLVGAVLEAVPVSLSHLSPAVSAIRMVLSGRSWPWWVQRRRLLLRLILIYLLLSLPLAWFAQEITDLVGAVLEAVPGLVASVEDRMVALEEAAAVSPERGPNICCDKRKA